MTVASQLKQTLASLQSTQATLKIYAQQSQAEAAKTTFTTADQITGDIINELEERLKILEFEEPQYKGV